MTEETKTKAVRLDLKTCERLDQLGIRGDTYETIITKLLEEKPFLQQFKDVIQKLQDARAKHMETGAHLTELIFSVNEAIAALKIFVSTVEAR